ncbi:MAG: hypothetical protein HYX86_05330 [Chloroflexi bacterium]|nr:hypothetical protein [Chloroflexota bacterium]
MDSAMIGKIEKAKRYAEEREQRIAFGMFQVTVQGNHRPHQVTFEQGKWACDCDFFAARGVCSHTMALERVLEGMLPALQEPAAQTAAR